MGGKIVRYIDLFAGMGGNRIAFEQALGDLGLKGKCVFSSEIKPHAVEVYKANFNNEKVFGDITKIDEGSIPDFDYMLASTPCQSYSFAGKRMGLEDARGTLFYDVARILKEKQPKGFFIENVEGLVDHGLTREDRKNGKKVGPTLEFMINVLEGLGYKVTWNVLAANDFGVAQLRRRVYIVGTQENKVDLDNFEKKEVNFGEIQERGLPTINSQFTKAVSEYLRDNGLTWEHLYDKAIRDKRGSKNNIHSWTLGLRGKVSDKQHDFLELMVTQRRKKEFAEIKGYPVKDGLGLTIEEINTFSGITLIELEDLVSKKYLKKQLLDGRYKIYDINGGKLSYEFAKILDPNKPSLTMVATDVKKIGVIDGEGIRRLTIREGLRLNAFPDDYKLDIDYNKAMDLLGNTVVVEVVKQVLLRVLNSNNSI